MSTGIDNAGSLSGYHSIPEPIDTATVNIPLRDLNKLFPGIQRFAAMAVKFSGNPDSLDELRVLLILRNGKKGSWGNTWETAAGTPEEKDPTIINSAARESEEETGIWPSKIAGNAFTCSFHHKDRKTGDPVLMRTLGFIIIPDNKETMAQRVWSSEMQQPVGHSSVEISDEHLDHCWFTEDEVRGATLYEQATPPGPFAMLLAKRDMILLAFDLFRQSQRKKWPNSLDIVR
ncbi:hypothetical protein N7453_010045 [Penicillium expansum]|nr:hypothetical protein N7453_010045 [Penicillium expansum]